MTAHIQPGQIKPGEAGMDATPREGNDMPDVSPISLITNGGGSGCIEGWNGIEGVGLAIHGGGSGG